MSGERLATGPNPVSNREFMRSLRQPAERPIEHARAGLWKTRRELATQIRAASPRQATVLVH